jgi:nucleoid-associated protein YgaU
VRPLRGLAIAVAIGLIAGIAYALSVWRDDGSEVVESLPRPTAVAGAVDAAPEPQTKMAMPVPSEDAAATVGSPETVAAAVSPRVGEPGPSPTPVDPATIDGPDAEATAGLPRAVAPAPRSPESDVVEPAPSPTPVDPATIDGPDAEATAGLPRAVAPAPRSPESDVVEPAPSPTPVDPATIDGPDAEATAGLPRAVAPAPRSPESDVVEPEEMLRQSAEPIVVAAIDDARPVARSGIAAPEIVIREAVVEELVPKPLVQPQEVENPVGVVAPSFDVVRIAPDGNAVIAGRAEPGAAVSVLDGDVVIGNAVADARGEWVVLPRDRLPPGTSELSLVARSRSDVEAHSEQVVVLVVPSGPANPSPAEQVADERPVAILLSRESAGVSRLLQGGDPGAGIDVAGGLSLDSVSYYDSGDVEIAGRALPGNAVAAYIDNRAIGTIAVDAEGNWHLEPEGLVEPGLYMLRIDQVDYDGQVVSRLETPFSLADLSETEVGEGLVVVQPGNSLWRLARRVYGRGVRHTLIFDANREQIRDPDLIYPGQIFIMPRASADG